MKTIIVVEYVKTFDNAFDPNGVTWLRPLKVPPARLRLLPSYEGRVEPALQRKVDARRIAILIPRSSPIYGYLVTTNTH
jgi:hypothetical protein